jgi:hypothetical protein
MLPALRRPGLGSAADAAGPRSANELAYLGGVGDWLGPGEGDAGG